MNVTHRRVLRFAVPVGIAAAGAYLALWPVPIDPMRWKPPVSPGFTGPYAANDALAGIEVIGRGVAPQPEDIAFDAQGRMYAGCSDGRILRWAAPDAAPEPFATTGGMPLGLKFDAAGHLIVADAYKGLLSISPDAGLEVLATEYGGLPFRFTDDLDIAADGAIYFTDASFKFTQKDYIADLVEHRPNGRLLKYDPALKKTSLVLGDLYFANGVAVAPDQSFVLVVETGKYQVRRYWLAGEKQGTADILIDNLPAFPDGIAAGTGGIFWIAMASPRDPVLDAVLPVPFMRRVILRLPAFLRPAPARYSFVLGIGADGTVRHNLQAPAAPYAPITNAVEHGGHLYFGSIEETGVARIARPAA